MCRKLRVSLLSFAARLFKGMELRHSISLGGGRSRGHLACSDKKLAFMDKGKKYSETKQNQEMYYFFAGISETKRSGKKTQS